jgi:hypothetical protein
MDVEWKTEARREWEAGSALKAGEVFYEHLRNDERPRWAGSILALASRLAPATPEIEAVLLIAGAPARWHEAKKAFQAVRRLTLRTTDPLYENLLLLAENAAKVTYNASGSSAPFDADSGWWIAESMRSIIDLVKDPTFSAEAESVLFNAG